MHELLLILLPCGYSTKTDVFTMVLTDFFLLYSLDLAFLTFFSFSVAPHIYLKENSEHDNHSPATDVHVIACTYMKAFLRLLDLLLTSSCL